MFTAFLTSAVTVHAAPSAADVSVTWQHHEASFDYVGITVAYNCDALEAQVGRILKFFGARGDLKVRGSCPPGLDSLSSHAWVSVAFDVPVESTDAGGDKGQWTAVALDARHPAFMNRGDCEIVQSLKELVVAHFGVRNLDYQASCTPHELSSHDFSVKGEILKVATRKPG